MWVTDALKQDTKGDLIPEHVISTWILTYVLRKKYKQPQLAP